MSYTPLFTQEEIEEVLKAKLVTQKKAQVKWKTGFIFKKY